MTRGVYRILAKESDICRVYVEYDNLAAMEITEQRYRERGYRPEFNVLPWKEDYEAAEVAAPTKRKRGPQETHILN